MHRHIYSRNTLDFVDIEGMVLPMPTKDLIQQVLDYIDRQQTTIPELEVLRLVAMTCLHPQALVGPRTRDVNYEQRCVTCTYKGMTADIPMTNAALDVLRGLETEGEYFFARDGQPVTAKEVLEHWDALCIEEGLHGETEPTLALSKLRAAALKPYGETLEREREAEIREFHDKIRRGEIKFDFSKKG